VFHRHTRERTDSVNPLEPHHVVLGFRDLVNIEERRRGRIAIVFPHNAMEQDRESRIRENGFIDERVDHLTRSRSL